MAEPVTVEAPPRIMDERTTPEAASPGAGPPPGAEAAPLVWVSHPLRRRPVPGAMVGLGIALASLALGLWTRSLLWGLFPAGALFLSLEAFFLPSRCEAGPTDLLVQKAFSKARTPWGSFRRVYEDRHGLTLSPYRRRTMLEPYRSVRLLFDGGDAAAIRETVRMRCPDAEWFAADRRGGKGTGS